MKNDIPIPTNKKDIKLMSEILEHKKKKSIKNFVKGVNQVNHQDYMKQFKHQNKKDFYSEKSQD